MMNYKILNVITVFVLCCSFIKTYTQDLSKSSLKYGIGYGFSQSEKVTGSGSIMSVGYEYDFCNDRLHFNPNFVTSKFSTKYILDAGDQWFNSMSLETILYYDLLRIKAIALSIGAGAVINNTQGYLATSGWNSTNSEFVNSWKLAGYGGIGFRINPKRGRLAFEILPLNVHFTPVTIKFNTKYLTEIYAKIGMSVRL